MARPSTRRKESAANRSGRVPRVSIGDRIKRVQDIQRGRSWCFYGRSGTGKTTLSSSFPMPALLLDCKDEGTDSVIDIEGLDVIDIEEHTDFEETFWYIKQNAKKYKTVIVDTVTMLQEIFVRHIADKKNLKNKNPGDWGTMTKQEWGEVASWLKTWITNYRSLSALGIEVVFLAQDRTFNVDDEEDTDGAEIEPEIGPRLSPSVKSHLCAAVSIIGNTFIRTYEKEIGEGKKKRKKAVVEYCVRLGPSASYITKIRKPKSVSLPKFLTDPSYEEILEIIEGE